MAVFLDPETGKKYDGLSDKQVASHGLVPLTPESQASYDQQQANANKPFGQQALETVVAGVQAAQRPVAAVDEWLSGLIAGGDAPADAPVPEAMRNRLGAGGSLGSQAQALAREHPIAAGIGNAAIQAPLALAGGVPGAVARIGAAAVAGGAEAAFVDSGEYKPSVRDLATYGGIQAAFEAASPVAGALKGVFSKSQHALDASLDRAAAGAATARLEREAATRSERLAAEAPLHFDRLGKAAAPEFEAVTEAMGKARESLLGKAAVSKAAGSVEEVAIAANDVVAGLRDVVRQHEGKDLSTPLGRTLRTMGSRVEIDPSNAPDAFAKLLDLRRALVEKASDELPGYGAAVSVLDDVLRRESAFGPAATRYAAVTEAGSLEAGERAWHGVQSKLFDKAGRADPRRIRSLLKDPAGGSLLREDIETALQSLDAVSAPLRRMGDASGADTLRRQAAKLREVLKEADEVHAAKVGRTVAGTAFTKMGQRLADVAARRVGGVLGSVAGGMVGGTPGALLGYGVGELAEGYVRSSLEQLGAQRARDVAFTAASMTLKPSLAIAKRAAGAVERGSPRAGLGASAAWRAFLGDDDEPSTAYQRSIRLVNESPERLVKSIQTSFAGIEETAPELFDEAAMRAFRVQNFLRTKQPTKVGVSLMNPEGVPPSRYAMQKWAQYYTAAMQPHTVLRDLASGRATVEQAETLKATDPELFDDVRNEAIAKIQAGARPTIAQRARLALLFDLSMVDPVFSPSLALFADQARQAQAQKMQQGKGSAPTTQQASTSAASRRPDPQRSLQNI